MYATFFILICCSCIPPSVMQSLSWDLVTSTPIVFTKQVELRCTVTGAACCSLYTRVWNKGSTPIISNGVTSSPTKYTEKVDIANNQFSLTISNLDKDDVDVVYTCSYLNDSPAKTLAQNDSFEYHPSGPCPVTRENGELVGTLNVAMSAPYPSVTAQYGGTNFTSYLTTTIASVTGSPKFYTINSNIKAKSTCHNNERFMLSVLTGVSTTNICNNEDLCKCGECGITCFGWSVLGSFIVTIVNSLLVWKLPCLAYLTTDLKLLVVVGTFVLSVVADLLCALLPGYLKCFCSDLTSLAKIFVCIAIGVGTCAVIFMIVIFLCKVCGCCVTVKNEISGSTVIFECPFTNTEIRRRLLGIPFTNKDIVKWVHLNANTVEEISDLDVILPSPIHDRVSLHRGYNLKLKQIRDRDKGLYQLRYGLTGKLYKLKLSDENDHPDQVGLALSDEQNASSHGSGVIATYGINDSKIIFVCPYKSTTSTTVLWSRVCDGRVSEISDGPKIADSQMKDRVSIVGDHKAGVYNLELKQLKNSDEGVYICKVGLQQQEYKLKVVAGEKHNK